MNRAAVARAARPPTDRSQSDWTTVNRLVPRQFVTWSAGQLSGELFVIQIKFVVDGQNDQPPNANLI
jgi:hypothetical protein